MNEKDTTMHESKALKDAGYIIYSLLMALTDANTYFHLLNIALGKLSESEVKSLREDITKAIDLYGEVLRFLPQLEELVKETSYV